MNAPRSESASATSLAARLLPGHPAVERALRSGALCLSAVGELARVLTGANEAEVLPRFLGRSAREAREVAAALAPCPQPPRQQVVTLVAAARPRAPGRAVGISAPAAAPCLPSTGVLTHELARTHPVRANQDEVEPPTADLRRLHVTVSTRFLGKVAAARTGLSHSSPGATWNSELGAAVMAARPKRPGR